MLDWENLPYDDDGNVSKKLVERKGENAEKCRKVEREGEPMEGDGIAW